MFYSIQTDHFVRSVILVCYAESIMKVILWKRDSFKEYYERGTMKWVLWKWYYENSTMKVGIMKVVLWNEYYESHTMWLSNLIIMIFYMLIPIELQCNESVATITINGYCVNGVLSCLQMF